jgi:hypothetical protein
VPLSPQILVIAVSWQKHDIQAFANALIRTPLFFAHLLVPTTPNPFLQQLACAAFPQRCIYRHLNSLGSCCGIEKASQASL